MQEKGIISTNQFVWILFVIITSMTSIQVPGLLIMIAGRDAWLSIIGGWFLDMLLAIVYGYMGIRFAGQNFVQYSITILGKYIGRIVGILFPLFFLLVSAVLIQGLSQLINTVFLPKTPLNIIIISAFLIIGYGARKGIEVIVRVAELLGPVYLFSIIILIFLLIPVSDINHLKPQFDKGIYPFLVGSPFMLTFYGICIMMAMLIPLCNKPENGFIAKFYSVSLGAFFAGAVVVFSVAVFGFEQIKFSYAPGLMLTRMINVADFIERFEVLWMMIVIGGGILASANLIWASSSGIAQIAGIKDYKPLVYPIILISLILSITSFKNNIEQLDFVHYVFPVIAAFIEAGLEIFLLIMALILKRRTQKAS